MPDPSPGMCSLGLGFSLSGGWQCAGADGGLRQGLPEGVKDTEVFLCWRRGVDSGEQGKGGTGFIQVTGGEVGAGSDVGVKTGRSGQGRGRRHDEEGEGAPRHG